MQIKINVVCGFKTQLLLLRFYQRFQTVYVIRIVPHTHIHILLKVFNPHTLKVYHKNCYYYSRTQCLRREDNILRVAVT